jgi:hypothetical protein
MQETYDELDTIVRTLDNLIERITNKDYIQQLEETKFQAEKDLEQVCEMIDEQQGQEGREEVYAHQRSVVYGI